MPERLSQSEPDFEAKFETLVNRRRDDEADVAPIVRDIIKTVQSDGDEALIAFNRKFDDVTLRADQLRFSEKEIGDAFHVCDKVTQAALETAAERIRSFHQRQRPSDDHYQDALGVKLGLHWLPIDSVGLYVPGGTAAYPSSVLMNAIPAKVAGCRRLVMTVPTPKGEYNPLVLVAARIAGVDEIYRVGGAQAIAALAYGTATIPAVDKVVGPGNAYVAEAKRQVFGRIGIDMIAGPSEIVVVADRNANPVWIAADLLSQAEHDPQAQAILITDNAALADQVDEQVSRQLETLVRAEIASVSWQSEGAIIIADDLDKAVDLVNSIAPEHLELMLDGAEHYAERIRHAGSIFIGNHTPEVIGDYIGGPNHVLPTGRTARFASGLAVWDFLKRTTTLHCSSDAFSTLGPPAQRLAEEEGLEAHAQAIARRLDNQA